MTTISDETKIENKRVAAAGIVCRKDSEGVNEFLLIKRSPEDHWPHHYEFPRGKCDKPIGEKPTKCAKREIKEETGLDVEILEYLGDLEYLADEGKTLTTCHVYHCKVAKDGQKVKLSNEHSEYIWVTELGMASLMLLPDMRKMLEKVMSKDNKIFDTPQNSFTVNNRIDEFLQRIQ